MLNVDGRVQLSASDLIGHLNCRHLTGLELAVTKGTLKRPYRPEDPVLEALRMRGQQHEDAYVSHLRDAGHVITVIDGGTFDNAAASRTRAAMQSGADVIVQGAIVAHGWGGRPDILQKVASPSGLGNWSYEVIDTKLARETKGGTVLQLCLYSELVASVQGTIPERSHVVTPQTDFALQTFRTDDYGAYYRWAPRSLRTALENDSAEPCYPEPVEYCGVCRWRQRCDERWRADDDLSLVAGISKIQKDELKRRGLSTTAALASEPLPLAWKPARGTAAAYHRVREQARIQVQGRSARRVIYEALPIVEGCGLSCLPEPSAGDIFFDLEGDPFVGEGGLEYLFGYSFREDDGSDAHKAEWALSRTDEKVAFERFVDFVMDRLQGHPDLHIYHYAPYEPAALKRLMGRYATREDELDRMLRGKLFVDLYGVVRHAIRASVESYSIKRLEPLYNFERATPLPEANVGLARVQTALELDDADSISADQLAAVESYNRDDCISTWRLREWLESVRSEQIAMGATIARPTPADPEPSEGLTDRQRRVADLVASIAGDLPVAAEERKDEQQARWILAHLLDWHRREKKSVWWEKYRLSDLPAEDLIDERAALSGLEFTKTVGGTVKAPVHRYSFPPQETDLCGGEALHACGGAKLGTLDDISVEECWVDIKKRKDTVDIHPEGVFGHDVVPDEVLAESLLRLGDDVRAHGIEQPDNSAARGVLLRAPPDFGGEPIRRTGESALDAALRLAPKFVSGVLPVQGPPGTGKTHIGARMICECVEANLRVGVTANSHKVIRHLLDKVAEAADERGLAGLACIQKVPATAEPQGRLQFTTANDELLSAIATSCQVAGATSWLWARPDAADAVDVLFVDEAAQVCLANLLAVSQAAPRIVLLGDPQQLDQPMQGSHPEGTAVSAMDYLLAGQQTVSDERGIFVEETWRLHPRIAAFTSELFYEGRLRSREGLEKQEVRSTSQCSGAGLVYVPVPHVGNQNSSPEEANAICDLIHDLLATAPTWVDSNGVERSLTLDDVLIVAPYNAQVFELQRLLPSAKVGTVDKFQGQEAPIAIYSVTTSSAGDAPRGMDFLYSSNRLNVATSRAKAICILVASPSVFEAQCRTPVHMKLANPFCRYLEIASPH